MPGIALIFAKDGAPVAARRLADLAAGMRYRGSSVSTWSGAAIAMARISRRADDGGIASTTRWVVAFDGRLDNRLELAAVLGCPPPRPDGLDDGAIVAAALERWDREAAARLIGDFAIAAAQRNERRALLIRDVRGLRPLYYRDDARELICTSDLQSLVRGTGPAINDGLVAEWLTGAPASHSETVYAGVYRLPMAHRLEVTASASTRRQYWLPAIDAAVAGGSEQQRAERFIDVMRTATRARAAGVDRTALWLSGGLDSSTLAAMLHDAEPRHWHCFTIVHPASGIDERAFAAPVAAAFGAGHTVCEAPDVTREHAAADAAATLDIPSPPNGLQSLAARREVVSRGFDAALSGLGSDEWLGGSFLSYGDLARSGRYLELAKTVWADRHREESTRVRLQIAAWSLCPPWLQRSVRSALHRTLTPGWISPALARHTALEDRLRSCEIAAPEFPLLSQRALYQDAIRGGYVAGTEMQERANASCGLDERYPFHDRRLIELSLALPESDRWAGGRYKGIVRRAMRSRLPSAVVERQDSPNANLLVAATLLRIGGRRWFERLTISDLGWTDRNAVLKLWDRCERNATAPGIEVWQLWAIAAIELWWVHAASRTARQGETINVA